MAFTPCVAWLGQGDIGPGAPCVTAARDGAGPGGELSLVLWVDRARDKDDILPAGLLAAWAGRLWETGRRIPGRAACLLVYGEPKYFAAFLEARAGAGEGVTVYGSRPWHDLWPPLPPRVTLVRTDESSPGLAAAQETHVPAWWIAFPEACPSRCATGHFPRPFVLDMADFATLEEVTAFVLQRFSRRLLKPGRSNAP